MKVIKKGRPQKEWAIRRVCTGQGNAGGGCGAHLLVGASDLFRTSSSHMGEIDYYMTFECPCCGVFTDVPESLGPCSLRLLPCHDEWKKKPDHKTEQEKALEDTARLECLEKILADEIYHNDVVLQSDHEDGVWVALRAKGIDSVIVMDGQDANAKTLRDALDVLRKAKGDPA